jgi:hypothetical protein
MAILSVDEIRKSRSGGIDAQWHRTYRRAWRVVTDGPYAIGALGARLAIPVFFGQYYVLKNASNVVVEFDTNAFAVKIEAQIDGDCNDDSSWIVTVDYGPYDPTQFPENPLNHPIKISWGENRFEQGVTEDINGDPVLNSAGDYFDPPITIDDSRPTLRIVRNERTYDPNYAKTWKDTLNADTFFGQPPNSWKMSTPLGDLDYNPVCGFYYIVTYQFEFDPELWKKKILDQGMRQIVGGVKTNMKDDDGGDLNAPLPLNGEGEKLVAGEDPVFLTFEIYQESDYSQLNLDPASAPGQG